MAYTVRFSQTAVKALKKLAKPTAALIVGWIEKNLEGTINPRRHGKGLTANKSGVWRYRVGKYRILATIRDKELIIEIVQIAHRGDVYKD